ncbi:MAG: hypothetical protein AAF608_04465 [Pseudomonadota bacterium]
MSKNLFLLCFVFLASCETSAVIESRVDAIESRVGALETRVDENTSRIDVMDRANSHLACDIAGVRQKTDGLTIRQSGGNFSLGLARGYQPAPLPGACDDI